MHMNRGTRVGLISLAILLVLFGIAWAGKQLSTTPPPDSIVCTADALKCPDGSWVGRSGPHCEFVCPKGRSR